MKILFIGDIVGNIGREMLEETLPKLKQKYRPQVTIANAENAAHGKGITEKIYKQLLQAGIDVITMGNHTWDNKDIFDFIDRAPKLVRPANFPKAVAGKGYTIISVNQLKLAIINLQGRVFMNALEDPFKIGKEIVEECRKYTPHIFIDFHAEVTSEKQALGWFMDGLASAVVGTHTHVQTNDARILPNGTAYLSDVGMTGAYDGILGLKRENIIERFQTHLPARHEVIDSGRKILSACFIELDDVSGKAKKIENIMINPDRQL
ncbi:TIGR00282 family metallophosphoesterase [Granulicatella sp. zg-ZJ]|uniref:TIGR00282 family metallophosphoesterase n=1 Tax=unclassified Granulicatella TaxID=2630493 RepID=UPI0013BF8769|nr:MULTISPECIES: TIGR00282 family metallophosphoesterase [unclassified Granulicatella]MBS4750732.1 TIGR00282 family metallophosphoesterase [Carnobacteriaceae bacterium zg-ZUI78]NEW62626.1 TIGR00282 family metallophosphoesterase [Granulicatella sp. zg-ZJ]NEW66474.1 TIGR00282 family metallophosphoesterase [Granulicatella sp. zg-84]QMI86017.1 TIGR00282 family metallophosphoesterase [Carnobacteriaceae bacterium zg-84]